ncbi:cytochrome c [soil metagenome]
MSQPKAITKIIPVVLLVAGLGATVAFAGPIEDRQAGMKQVGKSVGAMVPMFKGEKPYDAATVKTATAGIHDGWEKAFAAFTEDSKEGPPETYAKPEIWSDPEGFKAAQKNAMIALEAVAASTDEASFKAAFPALGKACGGCHEKFRRPKG